MVTQSRLEVGAPRLVPGRAHARLCLMYCMYCMFCIDLWAGFGQESGMSVAACYPLGLCCAAAGVHAQSGRVTRHPYLSLLLVGVFALGLAAASEASAAAETNTPAPAAAPVEPVTAQELARVYLQLQEQLRATQLAIEQVRLETKAAAAQNAEALSKGLQAFQDGFATQRARDWGVMQRSNRIMLVVVGALAAMSFLTMLIMTYFQWRMSRGLAEISAALPAVLGLGTGPEAAAFVPAGSADLHLSETSAASEGLRGGAGPGPHMAQRRFGELNLPPGSRVLLEGGTMLQRPRIRALRTAVIVGLICAAVVALVLYLVTYQKLGFGHLRAVLKI